MSQLRERLQEAAEAAAREGRHPTAAALVRRGRRRRLRRVGGTAVLVVLAVVAVEVGVRAFRGGRARERFAEQLVLDAQPSGWITHCGFHRPLGRIEPGRCVIEVEPVHRRMGPGEPGERQGKLRVERERLQRSLDADERGAQSLVLDRLGGRVDVDHPPDVGAHEDDQGAGRQISRLCKPKRLRIS